MKAKKSSTLVFTGGSNLYSKKNTNEGEIYKQKALELGFKAENNFEEIINIHITDELVSS